MLVDVTYQTEQNEIKTRTVEAESCFDAEIVVLTDFNNGGWPIDSKPAPEFNMSYEG